MRRMSGPNASLSRCAMPAVGSSRHSTLRADAIRQASSTIRRVPVDSSLTKRSRKRPRPRKSMISSASARVVALPGRARRAPPARPSRARVRSGNSSAPWNERPRPRRARAGGERRRASRPRISTSPRLRHETADRVHQRRLAGTVRTDESDDLAGRHVQVDRVDDGAGAEANRHLADAEHRVESLGKRAHGDAKQSSEAAAARRRLRFRWFGARRDDGEDRVAGAVEDLYETTGEVQEQDQHAGAARQQADLDAVVEQLRQADHEEGADTAPATDERPPITTIEITRNDSAARKSPGDASVTRPTSRPPADPGDPAADAERHELHPHRRDAERRRRRARCRARRSSSGPSAAALQRRHAEQRDGVERDQTQRVVRCPGRAGRGLRRRVPQVAGAPGAAVRPRSRRRRRRRATTTTTTVITANANVVIARYNPGRRSAGSPTRIATSGRHDSRR